MGATFKETGMYFKLRKMFLKAGNVLFSTQCIDLVGEVVNIAQRDDVPADLHTFVTSSLGDHPLIHPPNPDTFRCLAARYRVEI